VADDWLREVDPTQVTLLVPRFLLFPDALCFSYRPHVLLLLITSGVRGDYVTVHMNGGSNTIISEPASTATHVRRERRPL